jgi:superkiller protein 3
MFEKKDRKLATILTVFFLFGLLMMAGSVQADLNKAKEHFNTAVKAKQDGNVEGAIIAYKAAINEEPSYVDPYMNLGAVYFESKDYENALDMFRKATDADKTNVGAFSSLGRVEFKLKKYAEAEAAFMSALDRQGLLL